MKTRSVLKTWNFVLLFAMFLVMTSFFTGCQKQQGYWIPGTDPDATIISPEDYAQLPEQEQTKYVAVEYRQMDEKVVSGVEAGLNTANIVYEDIRPLLPEPLATGGTLILGLLGTVFSLLSRKKVVTKLIETAKGIQAYRNGEIEDLDTALSKAQSSDTKIYISKLKIEGTVEKDKTVNVESGSTA